MPELALLYAIFSVAQPGRFWLRVTQLETGAWDVALLLGDAHRSWRGERREDALRACHDWLAQRGAFDGPALPAMGTEATDGNE